MFFVPPIGWAGGEIGCEWIMQSVTTSPQTSYTFYNMSLGEPSEDRHIIVGIAGGNNGRTVQSLTIGGVTATYVIHFTESYSGAIFIANVPNNTTANIVVNWSGSQDVCGITVWRAVGLDHLDPYDTASDNIADGASYETVLDVTNVGFSVGIAILDADWSISSFWDGLTIEHDTNFGPSGGLIKFTGATRPPTREPPPPPGISVTATGTLNQTAGMAVASWGPTGGGGGGP